MTICTLCHDDTAVSAWKGYEVCTTCLDAGQYYDNLTPTERRIEDAAMARYVDESSTEHKLP